MRNALPFDTHAYVKKLVASGVPEAQAEVHAGMLGELVIERLATKEDLQQLKVEFRADLKELELRLTLRFGAMVAAGVAVLAAMIGVVIALIQLR